MGKILLKLSVLLLISTAVYSTIGCGKANSDKQYKDSISEVIKHDHEFSVQNNAPYSSNLSDNEKLDELSRRRLDYVQSAKKSLNYDELPSDFVAAYTSHLNAWEQEAIEISRHPDMGFWSNIWDGFVRGLFGDLTGGAFEKEAEHKEWVSRVRQHEDDIHSTWREVEDVGLRYGVNVNDYE